jgi:DNA recombination protein RmuC
MEIALEIVVITVLALAVGVLLGWSAATTRVASRVHEADVRAAAVRAELEAARVTHAERVSSLEAAQEHMRSQFRSLAAEALAANNAQFLGLAEQRLRTAQVAGQAELAQREAAVRAIVEPLTGTIERVQHELTTAEKARLASASALEEQLRAMREVSEGLRSQTGELVTALRSSQVRGAWGELQLRRVVESAGMLRHVDFVEQDQVRTDGGSLRPDLVVRLAGGKNVVVDAKVAFLGYLEAQQATEPSVRAARLAAHARHFRSHVDSLGTKQYWEQFSPAPEFVVMFVPAEPFLSAALEQDPTLLEHAFARNVVIATPMTLVALLRTVAYAWRQEALAENAQRVLTLGRELHGRLATMAAHLTKLGRQIDGAATAYNRTVSSLESRVLVSARRFADLEVVDQDLAAPDAVTTAVVRLSAPELVEASGALPPERGARGTGDAETAPTGSADRVDSGIQTLVERELRRAGRERVDVDDRAS